jgi:alanine racemase
MNRSESATTLYHKQTFQPRATYAEINLSDVGHNLGEIKRLVSSRVKILGVVKANAYGHGDVAVARYLESKGVDMLGVALISEAIKLRENGITAPILVFYGGDPQDAHQYVSYNLQLTINSLSQAEHFHDALQGDEKLTCQLKVDTGMGRVGVPFEDAASVAQRILRLGCFELTGIYTHLATSEGSDDEYLDVQIDRFLQVIQKLRNAGIELQEAHCANSGAIIRRPDAYFTMVRPGIILYGSTPSKYLEGIIPLREPLTWKSVVTFCKDVPAGTGISYGRKYITQKPSRIATIPVGYADGYLRSNTGKSNVLINGRRYPVVGTVCMDQIMVDTGDDRIVSVGDEVTLLGRSGNDAISSWELASCAETIPYEVFCAISARVPRIYKAGDSV